MKYDASKLRLARKSKKLTQEDLAAKTRVTRTNVCHWEKGKHKPSGAATLLLARALGVSEEAVDGLFVERRSA